MEFHPVLLQNKINHYLFLIKKYENINIWLKSSSGWSLYLMHLDLVCDESSCSKAEAQIVYIKAPKCTGASCCTQNEWRIYSFLKVLIFLISFKLVWFVCTKGSLVNKNNTEWNIFDFPLQELLFASKCTLFLLKMHKK